MPKPSWMQTVPFKASRDEHRTGDDGTVSYRHLQLSRMRSSYVFLSGAQTLYALLKNATEYFFRLPNGGLFAIPKCRYIFLFSGEKPIKPDFLPKKID